MTLDLFIVTPWFCIGRDGFDVANVKTKVVTGTKRPDEEKCDRVQAKVLLVEDSEDVARITELVLRNDAFDVRCARDGPEAIKKFCEDGPFDILLTDVVLPGGLSGYKVAEKLREMHPSLPVIFFTGHADMTIEQEAGFSNEFPHLIKPAMISQIREAVATALSTDAQ